MAFDKQIALEIDITKFAMMLFGSLPRCMVYNGEMKYLHMAVMRVCCNLSGSITDNKMERIINYHMNPQRIITDPFLNV